MKPVREVLPNGLAVLVAEHHDVETVAVSLQSHAGARFDPPGRDGLAHMTGALLRDGTAHHTKEQIAEAFDSVGADVASGSGRYTGAVSARLLARDLDALLPFVAEIAREPSFPGHAVEIRRGEMLTAIDENEQDPRRVAGDLFRKLVFPPGHPLAGRGYGTRESVSEITRDEIAGFHAARFAPGRSSLVLVGDADAGRMLAMARDLFGSWTSAAPAPEPMPPTPPLDASRAEAGEVPGTYQVELILGFPGIARSDPDYYALELVNEVLGEFGMGGRLGARVREEHGLAYSIGSTFDASLGAGAFMVHAGVDPSHVAQAVEDILAELARMRDEGPGRDEVERSRRALVRGFPLRLETQAGIAGYLQHIELHGLGLDYASRYAALLESVSDADLRRVAAARLTPGRHVLALAGPGPLSVP